MIVEYTRKAIEGLRNAPPARVGVPWYETGANSLNLEQIRNRDRPQIAFPKGGARRG